LAASSTPHASHPAAPPAVPRPASPLPKETRIPKEKLDAMRTEFEFWYPFDLRVGVRRRGGRRGVAKQQRRAGPRRPAAKTRGAQAAGPAA
jgi:hypothetical protein